MNVVVLGAKSAKAMLKNDGRGGFKRWAPPTPDEIRKLRQDQNLSQAQFAKRYGLDVRTLQNWEQGVHVPEQASAILLNLIGEDGQTVAKLIERVEAKNKKVLVDA